MQSRSNGLPQRIKSILLEFFLMEQPRPNKPRLWYKGFFYKKKTLILAFEVLIMQPLVHTHYLLHFFSIFSLFVIHVKIPQTENLATYLVVVKLVVP